MPHRSRILFTLAALLTATLLSAAPAGAQVSDQDTQFLIAAHQSNLAEIAAGQAAQQQATTDTVRRLGQMFIEMHTQLDQQVTAVAGELGVQLPGTPSEQQQAELAAVTANTGPAFDTAWIAQQLGSHQRSLANGSRELQAGSDERVIALARASAPVIEQHLAELRQAAAQYGVPTGVPGGTGGQATATTPRLVGTGLAALGVLLVATSAFGLAHGRRRA